jgi:hypothetical protein
MKNIKTFENYDHSESYGNKEVIKEYGVPFPLEEVKVGKEIVYSGSPYTVDSNDGYIIIAKSEKTGSTVKLNQKMFNDKVLLRK